MADNFDTYRPLADRLARLGPKANVVDDGGSQTDQEKRGIGRERIFRCVRIETGQSKNDRTDDEQNEGQEHQDESVDKDGSKAFAKTNDFHPSLPFLGHLSSFRLPYSKQVAKSLRI
jgi:hypothetical protein